MLTAGVGWHVNKDAFERFDIVDFYLLYYFLLISIFK